MNKEQEASIWLVCTNKTIFNITVRKLIRIPSSQFGTSTLFLFTLMRSFSRPCFEVLLILECVTSFEGGKAKQRRSSCEGGKAEQCFYASFKIYLSPPTTDNMPSQDPSGSYFY